MPGFLSGIRPINRKGALRDARAGIGLAATSIPQVLGYTRIAGMPVATGFYTLLLPLVAFAVAGSSRYLVVAADSATAAILASGLANLAPVASPKYIALAGYVALLTAAFLLLGRFLKLGFIADFLSRTVLVGFLTGVGIQVGTAVLGQTLGLEVHSRKTVSQWMEIAHGLAGVHMPSLLVSGSVLLVVMVLHRFAPKVPGPLVAVVGATTASAMWNLSTHGVAIIGPVAGGLPHLGLQLLGWREILPLVSVAGSCTVMIITQSAATARVYALRHDEKVDEDQDLIGLSAANAMAALSGSFVVNGSPSQTATVESVGSQSQIAQLAAAGVVACVLLFLTGPLQYLPQCVLGALVLIVAIRMVDLRSMANMRRESPGEFALAATTAAAVILAGVEVGILLAMALSLLRIVRHSYHPHTGVLIPDQGHMWKIVPATPGVVTEPGLVMYQFGAALFYANSNRFAEEILGLVGPQPSAVRWVIVDAEAITNVDYSAARVILAMKAHLDAEGVRLGFARVPWETSADFARHHVTEAVSPEMMFIRLHDALDAYEKFNETEKA